jgi:hypothetical protein
MKNHGSFRFGCGWVMLALFVGVPSAWHARALGQAMPGMAEAHDAPRDKVRSTSLTVTVGEKTETFSLADLAALPHETVSAMNAHLKKTESYSGVPIAALLAKMGLPFEKANEHTLLKSYLVAEGTDGYTVVVSAYEAIAAVHTDEVIVADAFENQPIAADGALKLVISGDKRPQRWVQNLKSITLKTVE